MFFNGLFLKSLEMFSMKGNSNFCYNYLILLFKLKFGMVFCDSYGFLLLLLLVKDDLLVDENSDYDDSDGDDFSIYYKEFYNGLNKVVFGVVIGFFFMIFFIIFLVCMFKCCCWEWKLIGFIFSVGFFWLEVMVKNLCEVYKCCKCSGSMIWLVFVFYFSGLVMLIIWSEEDF